MPRTSASPARFAGAARLLLLLTCAVCSGDRVARAQTLPVGVPEGGLVTVDGPGVELRAAAHESAGPDGLGVSRDGGADSARADRFGGGAGPDGAHAGASLGGLDLQVAFWTSPSFPSGLNFGDTNGISWGDYDADGFPDVFACDGGLLWRNLGGTDFVLAADVTPLMPPATIRYGASFGDYDRDGLPDIAIEPRNVISGDTCFHLLHNDGGGAFTDVAPTLALDLQPCGADGETIGWADVDGDAELDLFLPVYPPWANNGPGNFFLHALGPVGPGGDHAFSEQSGPAGLDIPQGYSRPEGAQFADADGDGDLDLYSNGTLYQNNSSTGVPQFVSLPTSSTGIASSFELDEGAIFFDYDLDGDLDLFVAYESGMLGVRLYESRGDSSFYLPENSIIEMPFLGAGLGIAAEDWDDDGDIDFSTRQIFRRNQLVETGTRKFTVALHPIPQSFTTSATPAWADWDRDGDLDLALGNYLAQGSFWINTLYSSATPPEQRRFVRVRVLSDSPTVPAGTETEYGALVELRIAGESPADGSAPATRRRKFTASGHGYLNQNEYDLTFGLPPDPFPADPAQDLVFDVSVDFPGIGSTAAPGSASGGLRRIDKTVNPALGGIALSSLVNAAAPADTAPRTISVYRSGRARVNGVLQEPLPLAPRTLLTSGAGLALPTATTALAPPIDAGTANRFVGVQLDTLAAVTPVALREIVLDGQLDLPVDCDGPGGLSPFNIALWDVTVPGAPALVPGGTLAAATSARNRRTFLPVDWELPPARSYRLAARVTQSRFSLLPAGLPASPCAVTGGFSFVDGTPCTGTGVASAPLQATRAYLAVRYAALPSTTWTNLGQGTPGFAGQTPALAGSGQLLMGFTTTLSLSGAAPDAACWLVLGVSVVNLPLKGGVLVPGPLIVVEGLASDSSGALTLSSPVPAVVPAGVSLIAQCWVQDAAAAKGFSASNGLSGTPPPGD